MNTNKEFPIFDDCFSDLNQFILKLVGAYEAGRINSWNDLEQQVITHFNPERMQQMESVLPGWQKMASYSDGITLVHVMCVFLGLFMLPEFQNLTSEQQQLAKWIVLFHDVEKFHIRGKKDTMHAFRSGVQTANILPRFGFATNVKYKELVDSWSEYTAQAFIAGIDGIMPKPDNQKLPQILTGIDLLYGENTPAALIIKTVLLHISLAVDPFYPTPAPLTEDEIACFIDSSLFPLLKVMMLADNEGWSLFEPETRARQRNDTLAAFQEIEKLISSK
ncbi:MAG TPA: hypothetical protein VK206_23580 [Anaerolineales bacterium]|nr:hypothetical protein [Anaerolineales bacterium]